MAPPVTAAPHIAPAPTIAATPHDGSRRHFGDIRPTRGARGPAGQERVTRKRIVMVSAAPCGATCIRRNTGPRGKA
ncbi:hypothetical protein EGN72_03680 [Pseudorhodobacter sp. E13]|nr:hypothetical protein EGN72_03680 [Pseudorhodobacter sp. E13]